ncbi:MAG: lysylphosphatidylglycerol synthase transmembrane domain-containing protein [Clostridia bacterium]|nr:lysylphosphatidylglycerol synthase transmembrane domain-containing protein [Clostridia bacterium]
MNYNSDKKYQGKSNLYSFLFRLLVTGSLLGILYWQIDFQEVGRIISGLHKSSLVIAILLVFAAIILSAYKWQLLLAARGWRLPFGSLVKVYFLGLFANNFLPSSIGGDLIRIYQIGKRINNHTEAAASVILERILATIGLALPVLLAILPNQQLLGSFTHVVFYFLLFCVGMVIIIIKPEMFKPLLKLPWDWWQRVIAKLKDINLVIKGYRTSSITLWQVIGYSVLFQIIIVLINYFLLHSLKIDRVSFWQCLLIVPIISALSMIPISINGLGIREGAYVLLLAPLHVTSSQAVILSLLFFLIVTVVSLLGGVIFLLEREKGDYLDGREITP